MSAATDRVSSVADARREVVRLKQELDDAFDRYDSALRTMPIAFQGDVHKFMCVRLSGYLEQLFFTAITGYLKSTGGKAGGFGLSYFRNAPNLRPETLSRLIARFGDEWSQSLEAHLDQHDRRGQLGTMLKVRNTTAHGGNYRGSRPSVQTYKGLVDDLHNWTLSTLLSP